MLIENQLERTDHTHLGQLITYAASLNAVTIVWIASRFTDEHRAAMDWLNERTDQKIRLFGLEIELWHIGESPLAPKFNIVSKPNDWSRAVQQEAAKSGELTDTKQLQVRFWTAFREFMEQNRSTVRCTKPLPQNWMNYALGRSGIRLVSIMSTWDWDAAKPDPEVRTEVSMDGSHAKEHYSALLLQKDRIEAALGFPLIWYNPEDRALCRLYVRCKCDVNKPELWPEQFEWLRHHLESLYRVFAPMVKTLAP